jgi:hypothetical protein
LYHAITRELRTYAASLDSIDETKWLDELIDEFDAAFRAWEYDPRLRLCLERVDRVSIQAFQVTAHAYIHITYDLPRCIATCLDRRRRPPGQGARDAYFRARDLLCETFERACVNVDIFGRYAYGFRVWRKLPLLKEFPFGIWASDLRERSFHLAEQLLVSTNREADESLLWRNVERNLKSAGDRRNPFAWLKLLMPLDLPNPKYSPDVLDLIRFVSNAEIVYSDEPPEDSDDGPASPREGPTTKL